MKLSEWWEPGSPMYLHYRAKETTCNACWEPVSDANPLEPKKTVTTCAALTGKRVACVGVRETRKAASTMARILALPPIGGGGCSWYRMEAPVAELAKRGHEIFPPHTFGPGFMPDIVFYQRVFNPDELEQAKHLQSLGARFVMDFDDDFWHLPMSNPVRAAHVPGSPEMRVFEEALRVADVVTCSTQPLAEAARKYRENIVVVENAISDKHFEMFGKSAITASPSARGKSASATSGRSPTLPTSRWSRRRCGRSCAATRKSTSSAQGSTSSRTRSSSTAASGTAGSRRSRVRAGLTSWCATIS